MPMWIWQGRRGYGKSPLYSYLNSDFNLAQIECEYCNRWQHHICYGYIGNSDPRVPTTFACNACLLPNGSQLRGRAELVLDSLTRKAIHILFQNGFEGQDQLSAALRTFQPESNGPILLIWQLDCDAATARRVTGRLLNEGLLVVKVSTRLRSRSVNEAKYRVVEDEDVFDQVTEKYFDPTLKIEFLVRKFH
jgi:hypothetical protein